MSVFDSAKDMWNREIEGVVRKVQYTDWSEVREQIEKGAERVWGSVRDSVGEVKELGEKTKEPVFAQASVRGREG